MKFNSSIKTISISERTRVAFELLDQIRPNDISFSSFLGIVVEDYLDGGQHKNNTMSLDLNRWAESIIDMTPEELSNLQTQLRNLTNLVENKVSKLLC